MTGPDPYPPRASFADQCDAPCCETMLYHLTNRCEQHAADPYACPDALVSYNAVFDEYGIIVHDGGPSSVMIEPARSLFRRTGSQGASARRSPRAGSLPLQRVAQDAKQLREGFVVTVNPKFRCKRGL